MDLVLRLWPRGSEAAVVMATTAVATVALLAFLRWSLYPVLPSVIPGPLQTVIPKLSPDEVASLEYPPDAYPGARDVVTPVRRSLPTWPYPTSPVLSSQKR